MVIYFHRNGRKRPDQAIIYRKFIRRDMEGNALISVFITQFCLKLAFSTQNTLKDYCTFAALSIWLIQANSMLFDRISIFKIISINRNLC